MKILISFLSLFIFSTLALAQSTDFQQWNDVQLIMPLKVRKKDNKKTDQIVLNLDGIVRLGRNDSYPVDDRASASIDFRVNKFLRLTPGYLYQRQEQIPNQRTYETRISFAANFEKKFNLLTLRHREMIEYRFRNFRPNTEVYRSRLQFAYLLKHKKKELFSPFISEEPYYDFKLHIWNRNELQTGITRKLSPKTSIDLYYIRAYIRPLIVNGIGTTLRIRLW